MGAGIPKIRFGRRGLPGSKLPVLSDTVCADERYKPPHEHTPDHGSAAAVSFGSQMMKPSISLSFNGNCAAALRFYERCLPGKILFEVSWGASPLAKDAPPEWATKICHSTLVVGDTTFHGVDVLPGTYEPPRGFSIVLDIDDIDKAARLVGALAENGLVRVPLQETFWARRYGMVVDQFGIAWEINCGRPAAPS